MIKIIKKKIKLLIFFLVFIIVSPLIVLYANGDIFTNGWSILKTGGIYINSAPINSEIYLNSKFEDNVSFFQRNLLIKNLRPDTYNILVKKDGYNDWSTKVLVLNNLVSDINVFILPQKIDYRLIEKQIDVENKKGTTTVIKKIDNQEYIEILKIFNSTSTINIKNSTSTVLKEKIGTKDFPIINGKLTLWKDGKKIFVAWNGNIDSAPRYFCSEGICNKTIEVFSLEKEPVRIDFLPGYEDVLIISSGDSVFADIIEDNKLKNLQMIYIGIKPDFRIMNGLIYIKDDKEIREYSL